MAHQSKNYYIEIDSQANNYLLPDLTVRHNSNNDFVKDLVVAGNRIKFFLNKTAELIPDKNIDKLTQGILLGFMVRLVKLYDSFLLLVCNDQS
jgi:hypothetical protein